MRDYMMKITIDDGDCAWEYEIDSDGSHSIHDIAKVVHKYLRSEKPLEGKFVEGSDERGIFEDKN